MIRLLNLLVIVLVKVLKILKIGQNLILSGWLIKMQCLKKLQKFRYRGNKKGLKGVSFSTGVLILLILTQKRYVITEKILGIIDIKNIFPNKLFG